MLIGKRIGDRYKVLEVIGGGGMSNVYLAHDMILDRDVAMKVLHHNFTDQEEIHRRFQREVVSATSLTHPNIVSIFDVGEQQDMHYLVMEYVKGQTLKQYIQSYAPLSFTRCVTIMNELTSAIAHAHNNQIIHRDIKPQNILMSEEGHVKVTDFGIAMALTSTSFTKTNSVLGTVHYLSPEQARGGVATKKSDIYSLGIVLYELLTGELPFSGESAVSIALKHLQTETPSVRAIIPTIPQSLENVVLKATAKNPQDRYESVEAMREDLQTVLNVERSHEEKFMPLEDLDATKAMPLIKDLKANQSTENLQYSQVMQATKEPSKKKKKFWPILTMLVLLIGLVVGAVLLFPDLFDEKKVEVPEVSNMTLDKAIDQLQNEGLTIGSQKEEPSDTIAEGNVMHTSPIAGKSVKKGSEVDLIISEGKKQVVLDEYVGKDVHQVKDLLEKQGFKKVTVKKSYSEEEEDQIIKQSPAADEQVIPKETTVVLTVSKGQEYITVSDLAGYTESDLKEYAKSSGFDIRITESEYSETVPSGQVIRQTPAASQIIVAGSEIKVIISKGQEQKAVKRLTKTVTIEFEPQEEATSQEIKIYIQDQKHSIADVYDRFTINATTSKRLVLDVEEDSKGIYRVMRDNEMIYDETFLYDDL